MENLTFGIEIEYRDLLQSLVTEYINANYPVWYSKTEDAITKTSTDPSLGGEISSPILTNTLNTWEDIESICAFLTTNHASSLNTGAHIHIGANIFENNSRYFLRFLKLWTAYEHIIYRFSYGEYAYARDTLFVYAKPVSSEYKRLIKSLNLTYQDKFANLKFIFNLGKKRGLNLSNMGNPDKDTIEFRTPNGTLNPNIWYNNFNLFKSLIEYAKNPDYNEDLINFRLSQTYDVLDNKIYFEQAMELGDFIFKTEREKLVFLRQYLKDFKEEKEYKLVRF